MRLLFAALLSLFALACSQTASEPAHPPLATAAASGPPAPVPASPGGETVAAPHEGADLLGTKAREWNVDHWMNSAPLTLADLRGRVVLVRWFMSTRCSLCSATAPSLRAFDDKYRSKGLSVIGFYHHKDPEPLDAAKVEETVKTFGFQFPVAIDPDWRTLKDWWLDGHRRHFTSVSFLIDKQGTIRFIHPGGKYEPGSDAEGALRAQIEHLLKE